MNKTYIAGGTLTGLVFAGGLAGMVSAQSLADATALTQEQAIEIAQMEVAGEFQEVELEKHRGTQVYEIEIIGEDGVEVDVLISAETGEVLEVSHDDDEDCKTSKRHGHHDDDDDDDDNDDHDDDTDAERGASPDREDA